MIGAFRIEGHAIVSADERIADAEGRMPASLRNEADWRNFQAALKAAAVVVLGRRSHELSPNPAGHKRLVLSSSVRGIERRGDDWWWNPAQAPVTKALATAAPGGGIAAIVGGCPVFDLFLSLGFDAFHLARATRVTLPGGVPLLSGIGPGRSAADVLAAGGLAARRPQILDAAAGVTLVTWTPSPA